MLRIAFTCTVLLAWRSLAWGQAPKVTPGQVEQWMESLSNWGRWGKTDEMGALNLITPEKRRRAVALVRDGNVRFARA